MSRSCWHLGVILLVAMALVTLGELIQRVRGER